LNWRFGEEDDVATTDQMMTMMMMIKMRTRAMRSGVEGKGRKGGR